MKITGLFFAWCCESWVLKALQNHLKICEEIFISVQAHTPQMAEISDSTERLIREFGDERVKVIPKIPLSGNIDVTKCKILNEMLTYVCTDDVIMLCDSDEFYNDSAIEEIKQEVDKDDWDFIRVHDRFFCINMDWYLNSSHGRIWRVKPGAQFYPTQNMSPSPIRTKLILEDSPMFHYSMLMPLEYRKAFWESEQKWHMVKWLEEVYAKWDLDWDAEQMKNVAQANKLITGHEGFWFNDGPKGEEHPPYLKRFRGSHPDEMEYSKLRNIKDFRI